MKRKLCLGFLVLLMTLLLTAALVACNQNNVSDFNKQVRVEGDNVNVDINSENSYLKFSFPKGAPSIFHSLWIKDANYEAEDEYQFDIEDVEYAIVYTYNGVTTEIPMGNVTKDMVAAEDTQYLNVAGHKTIHLSTTYKGQTISGSFALHLKDHSAAVDLILLTFDLSILIKGEDTPLPGKYAYTTFGDTNEVSHAVYVNVEKGIEFSSWNEFVSNFTFMYENVGDENNMALVGIEDKTNKNNSFGIESTGSFKIDAETEFKTLWTRDVVTVKFDLNNPNNDYSSDVDPKTYFNGTSTTIDYSQQVVAKNIGVLSRPDANYFNCYRGYYFAGWYTEKEGGTLWPFSSVVGDVDRTLYGRWRTRDYSAVIYTMGGDFVNNITSSIVNGKTLTENNLGSYKLVDSEIKSNVTGVPARIILTGLQYGTKYTNYAIKLTKNNETKIVLLSDLLNKLTKGGTYDASNEKQYKVLTANKYCLDYTCKTDFNLTTTTRDDIETYVLWEFNDRDLKTTDFSDATDYKLAREQMMSLYFTRVLFKDSYTVKADGTVRLDAIKDDSLHELEIPANLWVGDKKYPISELGKNSVMNAKGLVMVDFGNAANLVKISESSFAHDINLAEVKNPNLTKVESVGRNAFFDTEWENTYSANSNVIVFNSTIYKYVGPTVVTNSSGGEDPLTEIDLTSGEYEGMFENVISISNGAFESVKNLETITLPNTIEIIEDNAFANIKTLKDIKFTKDSENKYRIKTVGANAFAGSTLYLSSGSAQYDETAKALILGSLYYKSLVSGTEAAIPAGIRFIAPNAFEKSGNVENVVFGNEALIEYIGEDAFYATKWITTNSGHKFTIVNGMLTAFYSTSYAQDDVNIIIPSNVKVINKHAFNTYAQYVKSIQFDKELEKIEDEAFVGAVSLKSLIFSDATVDSNGGLDNISEVSANAFANDGQLISGIKFYFTSPVIEELNRLLENPSEELDAATTSWFNAYVLYGEKNFAVEELISVRVNTSVVPNIMLKTESGSTNAINQYLNNINKSNVISKGLVIETSAGIKKYEDLDFSGSGTSIVKITSSSEYKDYFDSKLGFNQYVIKFKYKDSTYEKKCQIHPGDPDLFIITEYVMIKGATFYTAEKNTYAYDNTSLTKETENIMTIKGFEGDVDLGDDVSTFFTTHKGLDLSLEYTGVDDNPRTISGKYLSIEGFSVRNEVETTTAYINVNFYNLGTFRFAKEYRAQESKIKEITQTSNISIPLNANWKDYLSRSTLNLVGEDESLTPVPITSAYFDLSSVSIDTTNLGMGTCFIQYTKSGTVNGEILRIDAVYSIVLDADPTMFEYEVLNEAEGLARIIGCTAKSAQTIVVPTTWEKQIDSNTTKTYTITEIGYNTTSGSAIQGVFENFTSLETVYLGQTITTIGVNTFKGCTLLKDVYSAALSTTQNTDLTSNFTELSTTLIKKDGTVLVTDYQFSREPAQIVLPSVIEDSVVKDGIETVYVLKVSYKETLFETYTGILYLTYSQENLEFAAKCLLNNKIVFIVENENDVKGLAMFEFEKYDSTVDLNSIIAMNASDKRYTINSQGIMTESEIGYAVSENATDIIGYLANPTGGQYVYDTATSSWTEYVDGDGARYDRCYLKKYKFEYTLEKLESTSSIHFVYDIEDSNIEKTTEYVNVKINSIPNVSGDTIAIGMNYEKVVGQITKVYKVVDIEPNLTVENKVTKIYVPDSIFTICTFKNKNSVVVPFDVYASADGYMFETIEKLPASLTTIKANAFANCSTLTSLDFSIANKLSIIESYAFANSGLVKVDLSKNTKITEINDGTFKGCYKLEKVVLNDSVTRIGKEAFSGCSMLSSITGIANVKVYEDNAFNNCLSLMEFVLDNTVTKVGPGAFAGCKAIVIKVQYTEENIPSTWKQWNDEFNNIIIYNYKNNNLPSDGNVYFVYDGIRYVLNNDHTAEVAVQAFNLTNVVIPEYVSYGGTNYIVTTIGEYAFDGNTNLTSIEVTSSLTEIQQRAFHGCSGLKSFTGGIGLQTIAKTAFDGCSSLVEVPKVAGV